MTPAMIDSIALLLGTGVAVWWLSKRRWFTKPAKGIVRLVALVVKHRKKITMASLPFLAYLLFWDIPGEILFYRVFVCGTLWSFRVVWQKQYRKLKGKQQQIAHLPPRRPYVSGTWQESPARIVATSESQEHADLGGDTVPEAVEGQADLQRLPRACSIHARVLGYWQRIRQKPYGVRQGGPGA